MKTFLFLILLSLQGFAKIPETLTLVSGCKLIGRTGNVEKFFPGAYCVFFPDGRLLSTNKTLTMFDAEDKVLWSQPYFVHHQIKLSHDGERILTMFSEVKDDVREDVFAILDLEGKILHRANAQTLFKDTLEFNKKEVDEWTRNRFGAKYEMSHFNSISEIPKNSSKLPFMKEGNIIVNSSGLKSCIVSPDLKNVLDCRKLGDSRNIHDAQVTPQGTYLYFNNEVNDKSGLHSSAAEEFDPRASKTKTLFAAVPKVAFYSPNCGGVQLLGDSLLVSHVSNGAYFINRKTGKVTDYVPNPENRKDQEIKAMDLSSFLKARKLNP